jgi:hypothetical protein
VTASRGVNRTFGRSLGRSPEAPGLLTEAPPGRPPELSLRPLARGAVDSSGYGDFEKKFKRLTSRFSVLRRRPRAGGGYLVAARSGVNRPHGKISQTGGMPRFRQAPPA